MATNLFTSNLYIIRTLTNLHVGNGEANYSVIDNQVQRDPITNYPQINSSSLKGALREFTEIDLKKKNVARTVFGYEPNYQPPNDELSSSESSEGQIASQNQNKRPKPGYLNFFDAKLLALPVRTSHKPYMLATSKEVLYGYVAYCEIFGIAPFITKQEIGAITVGHDSDVQANIEAEDKIYAPNNSMKKLKDFFNTDSVVFMEDDDFRTLAKELPFVARNHLENGKSENLWYEEIVPRESLFYFALQCPNRDLLAYSSTKKKIDKIVQNHIQKFIDNLKEAKLHIGANTTVGYGLCEVKAKVEKCDYKEVADAEQKES